MRSRYKVFSDNKTYFITSSIVKWIPLFNEVVFKELIVNSLKYRIDKKQLELHAYVIMPNHIHLIISSENVAKFMKDFKSYTARQVIDSLKYQKRIAMLKRFSCFKKSYKKESTFQVWQEGYHPEMIINQDMFNQKTEYIHSNPVRAGLIEQAEDWKYSSLSNYIDDSGLLPIVKIY